jgi:hypothetical protein
MKGVGKIRTADWQKFADKYEKIRVFLNIRGSDGQAN